MASQRKQEFYMQKRINAKNDFPQLAQMERSEIENYEKEAEELEVIEAELLQKL